MKDKKPKVNINIEAIFIGDEPTFGDSKTEIGFARSLYWYTGQYGPKESKKYVLEYVKNNKFSKEIIAKLSSADEEIFKNLGFICRMVSRGAVLGIDKFNWIENRINEIISYQKDNFVSAIIVNQTQSKPEKSIQDKMFEYATQYINEIEGSIDEFIKSRKSDFKCYDWLKANDVKSAYTNQIKAHYSPLVEELSLTLNKEDPQLVESYSHWSKKELKSYFEFVSGIISDCEKYAGTTKTIRKPRKKKAIPMEKKVASVKYQKESVEYKIASVSPTQIIGAKQLWVFNTKYKKLGVYYAQDDSGFGVKGTTIIGFDENTSIAKTLRKPEEVLPLITKGKKSELKKIMETIKCKESPLNGRLNSDTVLLKIV